MKKNKLPSLIILIILTLITTLFWISFSIYSVFTKESKTDIPQELILKLDPNLDIKTLDEIKLRTHDE